MSERFVVWGNVIVITLFVTLIFAQANKKFVLDEVDFPVLAKAISETGTPYHYRGETDPHSLGLWHPPLYAYSLAAFVKVFGFNENTVRAFGLCCTLLSAFLTMLIYGKLFPIKGLINDRITLIFFSLFLLHPYTIANATVPDIDSTVLPVTILAFIFGLVRMLAAKSENDQLLWSVKNIILLSMLFALNLWAKLTTPLVLIPIIFLIFLVKGWSLYRSVVTASLVAIIGGLIFFVTYWLYCGLLNLPVDFTFRWLVSSFTKNSSSGGGVSALVSGVVSHLFYTKQYVNWLGLPFVFALTLSCCGLILQRERTENETVLLILAGFGLFVMAFYLSLTGAFGGFFKYPYTTFSILVVVVAHYAHNHLFLTQLSDDLVRVSFRDTTLKFGHQHTLFFLFAAVALLMSYYQLVLTKDIVIVKDSPVAFTSIFSIIGVAVVISIITAIKKENLLLTYGVIILLALMVSTQFGISRSQAIAVYPTKYHYGQIGLEETALYLKERLAPKEPIWSMKDIGHYANGTYIENYSSIYKTAAEITSTLQDVIKTKGVRYFVVTKGIGQDRVDAYAELRSALDMCCVFDQEFGNFVIYKAK